MREMNTIHNLLDEEEIWKLEREERRANIIALAFLSSIIAAAIIVWWWRP